MDTVVSANYADFLFYLFFGVGESPEIQGRTAPGSVNPHH